MLISIRPSLRSESAEEIQKHTCGRALGQGHSQSFSKDISNLLRQVIELQPKHMIMITLMYSSPQSIKDIQRVCRELNVLHLWPQPYIHSHQQPNTGVWRRQHYQVHLQLNKMTYLNFIFNMPLFVKGWEYYARLQAMFKYSGCSCGLKCLDVILFFLINNLTVFIRRAWVTQNQQKYNCICHPDCLSLFFSHIQ